MIEPRREPEGGTLAAGREVVMHTETEAAACLQAVRQCMTAMDYPLPDVCAVSVALEEALVNALRHGNKYDADKQVRCRYLVEPGQTMVEVEDEGSGFDCRQFPDLTALKSGCPSLTATGLALIRVLMGWVAFNKRGNRLVMGRNRSRG